MGGSPAAATADLARRGCGWSGFCVLVKSGELDRGEVVRTFRKEPGQSTHGRALDHYNLDANRECGDPALHQLGTSFFTDGTSGWTQQCADEMGS